MKQITALACLVSLLFVSTSGFATINAITIGSGGIIFSDNSVQHKAVVFPTCSSGEVYVNSAGALLCGKITLIPNGIATCVGSVCSVSTCMQGYVDNGGGLCVPAQTPISASMNTIITGSTAVGTVSAFGIPAATACGLTVKITNPAGATFASAVGSGVTPSNDFITPGAVGATGAEVILAGTQGFGSGEVMKVSFNNVSPGSLPSVFDAKIDSVFDCNGAQIFP